MPWKFLPPDLAVDVIVTPSFGGDLLSLARLHPVWIVDSEHNGPLIDLVWASGPDADLYEVSRCSVATEDKEQAFIELLPSVHQHYNWSNPR